MNVNCERYIRINDPVFWQTICRTAGPCDRHAGNVDRDDFAIVKVSSGAERRIRRVHPIRHSIGYRSLRKTNRSTISGRGVPLGPVRNVRGIFRLGPRKFSKFRALTRNFRPSVHSFVCPLSAFLTATQEISEGFFDGSLLSPGHPLGTMEYRGELSEIVFSAL